MLIIAVGMFLIGAVGIIMMMINIIPQSFDDAVGIYRLISFHRHWAPDYPTIWVLFNVVVLVMAILLGYWMGAYGDSNNVICCRVSWKRKEIRR